MPLMQGKSKKAFSKNVETEMAHGKPQDQALAISYNIKRKNSKKPKYANGGQVDKYKNDSAKTEDRPMPSETDNDSKQVKRNSGNKPAKNDSWVDTSTIDQAQKPSPATLKSPKPLKMARMVEPGGPFSVRNRDMHDDEASMMGRIPPETDRAQPPQRDNEEDAQMSGHPVRDTARQHNNGRPAYNQAIEDQYNDDVAMAKMKKAQSYASGGTVISGSRDMDYADGGPVMEPEDDTIELGERSDESALMDMLSPSEDEGSQDAMSRNEEGPDRQGPEVPDEEREHNNGRKPYADGGDIDSDEQPQPEADDEHEDSLIASIMSKRRKYAKGGEITEEGDPIMSKDSMKSDDSDQVDLRRNTQEDANMEDQASFDALRKENYSDSYMDRNQPKDSNEHGDDIDSDDHDMVETIRRKYAMKRAFR